MNRATRITSRKKYYALITIALIVIVAVISHFFKNNTSNATLSLPRDIAINNNLIADSQKKSITKTIRFRSSIIEHNLASAENAAGLTYKMDEQLNHMFAGQSIMHHIHPGDRLEVLFHEYFINDRRDHPGHIVAAEIIGKNQTARVVRFTTPHGKTGYFTANGESTKPKFTRIPLHYVRIGSYFSYHRYDPVVHKVQPHLGVDLDAPLGTPIKAIGNGVVTFCGQMRGYGNVIMIQYGDAYKTLYAHLEKFVAHMHSDERVTKGEVVGYVGCTGWCTGPHVHFAVFKNGVAVNPLTVHFPSIGPVPEQYRHLFFDTEDRWFHEMALYESAKLANK